MKLRSVTYNGANYQGYSEAELKELGIPDAVIQKFADDQKFSDAQAARKQAYIDESDPLFLEWQYDQTPEKEQAWRDKVADIKARYPLPSKS